MTLAFCPGCHYPGRPQDICPNCGLPYSGPAGTYIEKLLETVLSEDATRAGMAADVLTKWLHERRAIVPLLILLERVGNPHSLVLAARGLSSLCDPNAVPALVELLLDEEKPYVGRVAAAEALGRIGGEESRCALEQAKGSTRSSVAEASIRALAEIQKVR